MKGLLQVGVLGCLTVLMSCASPYTPNADTAFDPIIEFQSAYTVSIVNAQESVEPLHIGGKMIANLSEWTDVAIQITERELAARDMVIDAAASRSLSLALTEVNYRVGWVKISTQMILEAETGDGYKGTYTGLNSSVMMAVPKRQVDGALMRVVVDMLNDQKIIDYLKN